MNIEKDNIGEKESPLTAHVHANFYEGMKTLHKYGYRIISLKEDAQLRLQEYEEYGSRLREGLIEPTITQYGNWVREGLIQLPNGDIFLTKKSPILSNAKEANECHKHCRKFYLTDRQVKKALSNSVKISNNSIPTDRFGEEEITVYAFEDIAGKYGGFLKYMGVKYMIIIRDDRPADYEQYKPFAGLIWFEGVSYKPESEIFALCWQTIECRNLDCGFLVRGIKPSEKLNEL